MGGGSLRTFEREWEWEWWEGVGFTGRCLGLGWWDQRMGSNRSLCYCGYKGEHAACRLVLPRSWDVELLVLLCALLLWGGGANRYGARRWALRLGFAYLYLIF